MSIQNCSNGKYQFRKNIQFYRNCVLYYELFECFCIIQYDVYLHIDTLIHLIIQKI